MNIRTNPIEELSENVSTPFEQAHAMPKSVYTTEAFLKAELETIFSREWICAGRADSLKKPGDYRTMEIAGEPIIILRDGDGQLRAMSNVCRHRMSTIMEGCGNAKALVCPYHAWTYGLDGRLRGAPAMNQNTDFRREDHRLPPVRCEEWQGWIMVSLDPDAKPTSEQFGQVAELLGNLDMTDYRETFREEHRWDTNWKVLGENFMESYHLPACHSGTIGHSSKLEEMHCPPGFETFNYHWILKDDSIPLALAHPKNTKLTGDERRRTWLLSIYPALFITLTPGYFWYLSLHPDGPGGVKIIYGGGMSTDYLGDPEAAEHLAKVKALLDDVNVEDRGCTERVYRGLCSRMSEPGQLSHLERPNFEFAQYVMSKVVSAGA
ncbi:Salicylate 5-hydroxylase, large oxygenase componen [Hartmannibacter diazotrophicus]|uniref:Salicylate 5-hydroxylase, large oxygenase componen n=1 Tax=Hartmannibacter diazotrophicus TaxID=1482074 RepID=A0A2C9D914_9HYPH|nr:SRPBCC family protein [Hartmannibacter diazotrophicus]SON56812.1 Salicylate 5-hydroxylase, large oxygenase componen [Hartmannibacter diazotrophicus]